MRLLRPLKAIAVLTLIAPFGMVVAVTATAGAQTFTVLYSFAGYPTDGGGPDAGLLMDPEGNLYGTTAFGGNVNHIYCEEAGYVVAEQCLSSTRRVS